MLLLIQTLLLLLTVQMMLMLLVCGGGQGQRVQRRTVVTGARRLRGRAKSHGLHSFCSLMTLGNSKSEFMCIFLDLLLKARKHTVFFSRFED